MLHPTFRDQEEDIWISLNCLRDRQVESSLGLERPRDHGMALASVKWEAAD